jgi:hypothetical protein
MRFLQKMSSLNSASHPTPADQTLTSIRATIKGRKKSIPDSPKRLNDNQISLLTLPSELHLLIFSFLPCGPSTLFGLTNQYFYHLHRTLKPFPISLKHYCPDADSCSGTLTTPDPQGYYCGALFGQGVCKDQYCAAGQVDLAGSDYKGKAKGKRKGGGNAGHEGEMLGVRLKEWMGNRWTFCAVCDIFHRRHAAGRLGWGAACPHRVCLVIFSSTITSYILDFEIGCCLSSCLHEK